MEHLPLLQHQVDHVAGVDKGHFGTFIGNVTSLLGPNTSVQRSDGNMRYSRSHATTGIPYAISGTATVVESTVSAKLAMFTDPIKAILGTAVHDTQRIIIKRKYVAGGGAHIVPEHASARTVAIREDIREVMLSRYGNDIEMNLNLFLKPREAEAELKMKLEASQLALEKRLVRIGYEAVLSEGNDLAVAIARSRNQASLTDLSIIYNRQLFGIMGKSAYPITTLMAAAKLANAYACATADKTVMILPFGTPEIIKYTKPHQMEYMLSGVPISAQTKANLKVPGGFKDEFSNCTIYQHIPPTDISQGVPNLSVEQSLLTRYVTVFSIVDPGSDGTHILNYKTGGMWQLPLFTGKKPRGATADADIKAFLASRNMYPENADDGECEKLAADHLKEAKTCFIRRTRLKMRSGILAAPGSDTGELLYAYSSCSVTTNPSTELGKLGLRVYLGAIIKEPNNIFILPNIAFESVVSDVLFPINPISDSWCHHEQLNHGNVPCVWKSPTDHKAPKYDTLTDRFKGLEIAGCNAKTFTIYNTNGADRDDVNTASLKEFMTPLEMDRCAPHYTNVDNCAVFSKGVMVQHNTGSLGIIDHPDRVNRLNGLVEFAEFGPQDR